MKLFEHLNIFLAKFSLCLFGTDFFSFIFLFPQTSSSLNYVLSFSHRNKSKLPYCFVAVAGCAHTVWTERKCKKVCMREGKRNLPRFGWENRNRINNPWKGQPGVKYGENHGQSSAEYAPPRSQWKALESWVVFSSRDSKQLCLFFSHKNGFQ